MLFKRASPGRVFVVGVGLDPEPLNRLPTPKPEIASGWGDKPVVGFIGQLGSQKADIIVHEQCHLSGKFFLMSIFY